MSVWISTGEAARMLGYSRDHFRRAFCESPVSGLAVMMVQRPGQLLPRYMVRRVDVERLVNTSVLTG